MNGINCIPSHNIKLQLHLYTELELEMYNTVDNKQKTSLATDFKMYELTTKNTIK
jgi:hypothetical protein